MIKAMNGGRFVPTNLIPHCLHCGAEMFPWVRGYGNFLQGIKYEEEYQKISDYIASHKGKKTLFIELGVGRMTPMFIQEPFWNLTLSIPDAILIGAGNGLSVSALVGTRITPESLKRKVLLDKRYNSAKPLLFGKRYTLR